MKEPFDLNLLSNKLDNTEMTKVWLKMRLQPENYYIAFYSSGKFLITGVKDILTVKNIASRVVKLINDVGIKNSLENVEIKNMVMTDEIKLKSSLQEIIVSLKNFFFII